MAKWDISARCHLYVLWRFDGDFYFTKLDPDLKDLEPGELLNHCIHEEMKDAEDDEIEELISMALDTDHPWYIGYEMALAFISADAEFLSI